MDMLKTIRAAKDAAAKLADTEKELRARHAALVAERKSVTAGYPPAADLIASANRLIDEAAAKYATDFGAHVAKAVAGGAAEDRQPGGADREVPPRLPAFGDRGMKFSDLAGLFPELAKARLAEVIRAAPVRFGLGAAERAAKAAEIDAGILETEKEHTSLVDAAAEVGISLAYLDVVRDRREKAAREAERDRVLVEERAAGVYRASA